MAVACPYCGAPSKNDIDSQTSKNGNENSYTLFFDGFVNKNCYNIYRTKMDFYMLKFYNSKKKDKDGKDIGLAINTNKPCILFDRISKQSSEYILKLFSLFKCIIRIEPSSVGVIDQQLDQKIKEVYEDSLILKCPRCKSTAVTTGTKGYGLVRGFLGSNKTVNRCGSCGYSWEP